MNPRVKMAVTTPKGKPETGRWCFWSPPFVLNKMLMLSCTLYSCLFRRIPMQFDKDSSLNILMGGKQVPEMEPSLCTSKSEWLEICGNINITSSSLKNILGTLRKEIFHFLQMSTKEGKDVSLKFFSTSFFSLVCKIFIGR